MSVDLTDRACDLECVKGGRPRHEFVGPVKIVLFEPKSGEYQRKIWGAAVLTFAMLLMGATVFIMFAFTLRFKLSFTMNIHVFLCTMAFQLFLPSGILMFNPLFGGSAPLKPLDRKIQHFYLQIFGLGTAVAGAVLVLLFEKIEYTSHSYSGCLAVILTACNLFIGPTVCFTSPDSSYGQFNRKAHILFGLSSFVMGTICFVYGIWKESFLKWAIVKYFHLIIICFTIIYSGIVVASVWMRARPNQCSKYYVYRFIPYTSFLPYT